MPVQRAFTVVGPDGKRRWVSATGTDGIARAATAIYPDGDGPPVECICCEDEPTDCCPDFEIYSIGTKKPVLLCNRSVNRDGYWVATVKHEKVTRSTTVMYCGGDPGSSPVPSPGCAMDCSLQPAPAGSNIRATMVEVEYRKIVDTQVILPWFSCPEPARWASNTNVTTNDFPVGFSCGPNGCAISRARCASVGVTRVLGGGVQWIFTDSGGFWGNLGASLSYLSGIGTTYTASAGVVNPCDGAPGFGGSFDTGCVNSNGSGFSSMFAAFGCVGVGVGCTSCFPLATHYRYSTSSREYWTLDLSPVNIFC
jgi:hypothetical protein